MDYSKKNYSTKKETINDSLFFLYLLYMFYLK